ncbi:hypothetical protein QU487_20825 [Crenobacter sp. SG2305]|uniref:hypothetical protein n=1 Tax=Crenobacter oryzisoli TaxID=3056844 RepID=UPI0025AB0979|nr:hypothetical protein [Crenobacter sp. SG2305]MDN0085155.1 hypothetical protein [Crenobacter sp. SG2305]
MIGQIQQRSSQVSARSPDSVERIGSRVAFSELLSADLAGRLAVMCSICKRSNEHGPV